jgi:hypothetical protein
MKDPFYNDGIEQVYLHLVDNIPCVHLALVSSDQLVDMVCHDRRELGLVPDAADPGWKLRVPDRSVSTDKLVVGRSPVDQVVSTAEGELTLGSLCCIPLHAVLRGHLAEVVDDELSVGAAGQETLISRYTDVLLALCFKCSIDRALGSILARTTSIWRTSRARLRTGGDGCCGSTCDSLHRSWLRLGV